MAAPLGLSGRTGRILRGIGLVLLGLILLVLTLWGALALWYRLPVDEGLRGVAAGLFALFGVAAAAALFTRRRLPAFLAFAAAFAALIAWWSTIEPPREAAFAPDVARQVTGTIDGDTLTLTDVRDFDWKTGDEAEARWLTKTYDLSKLRSLDLFMSYWAGPDIAHVIFSFGFEGGEQLAWSIEVRRMQGGGFSPLADLFKAHPLIVVAATERDVVGVRAVHRGEDVQLYRMRAPPERARRLLLEYVEDANGLARQPEFYNSLTTNCTTTVVKLMRAVGAAVPFDWRLIVNGYLPDYAYDRGALDTRLTLAELRRASHIDDKARAAAGADDFSERIRVGVPSPLEPAS